MSNFYMSQIRSVSKNSELVQTRREKLIDCAIKLFGSRGFDKVTLDEIADAANMSKGAVYNYIGKKEDLVILILDYVNNDFDANVKNKFKQQKVMNWTDMLRKSIKAYLEMVDRKRDAINFLSDIVSRLEPKERKHVLSARSETYAHFELILNHGKASGEFNLDNTKLMVHNIVRMLSSWANNHWYLEKVITFDEYLKKETEFILKGLGVITVDNR